MQVCHQALSAGFQPVKLIMIAALVPSQLQLSHPAKRRTPGQYILSPDSQSAAAGSTMSSSSAVMGIQSMGIQYAAMGSRSAAMPAAVQPDSAKISSNEHKVHAYAARIGGVCEYSEHSWNRACVNQVACCDFCSPVLCYMHRECCFRNH